RRHARALAVDHAIDFRHDVREQKEVYALIKAAKVFVFPSEREGFGIAVLEALACGVPVITTSAPDNLAQHLVTDSSRGIVCDPSGAAIAHAVRRLFAEEGSYSATAADRDDRWLVGYSWDAMSDRVARALQI